MISLVPRQVSGSFFGLQGTGPFSLFFGLLRALQCAHPVDRFSGYPQDFQALLARFLVSV